jgi:hypothetical protein
MRFYRVEDKNAIWIGKPPQPLCPKLRERGRGKAPPKSAIHNS